MASPAARLADEADSSADAGTRRCAALAILVRRGLIEERDLESLTALMNRSSEPFDLTICNLALMSEGELADAFVDIFQMEKLSDAIELVDHSLAARASAQFLQRHRVFPLWMKNECIEVAIADPTDLTGLKGCAFVFEATATPLVATGSQIEALLAQLAPPESAEDEPVDLVDSDAERLRDLASAEPAVRLCNRLVADAVRARASDIHLEPAEREYRVRFRIDGQLLDRETLTVKQGLAAVSRLKILSNAAIRL